MLGGMRVSAAAPAPEVASAGGTWAHWVEWANGLPNFSEIGLKCVDVQTGSVAATLAGSGWTPNPNGAVNGGLVVAAADQCMGVVALTTLEPGALPATATLNAEFLRPAFAPLTLRASVAQRGKRLVFVNVDVEDNRGRLCVRCSGTMASQSPSAAEPPQGSYTAS
jgi:uncharacterized protein (TIGR00369 family)